MVQISTYNVEDQERMARAKNYFAWQAKLVCAALGRRVLEVGCGVGNFTRHLLPREAVLAIDAEAECIDHLLQRYPNQPNLRAEVCELTSSDLLALNSFGADSCVCLNVLEHIEDDCRALDRIASVLTPDGVIVLLVPALPALYGPIDRNLGHHRRYTRASLSAAAHKAGLRIRTMHFVNSIGLFGWWMNAHILRREKQSELQIEIFDRYFVPVLSRVEGWVHPPFGQSLFAVLQKF